MTLIELMMVIAIVGILAAIATNTYRANVLKAQEAQTLVYYGQIRTVVNVATQADNLADLHRDSVPGHPPPALRGQLGDPQFNGRDGIVIQMVRAPAGTFSSYPGTEVYALIATADNEAAVRRLKILRNLLPHPAGDKIWVAGARDANAQLIYPIDPGADGGAGSGGSGGGDTGPGGGNGGGDTGPGDGGSGGTSPGPGGGGGDGTGPGDGGGAGPGDGGDTGPGDGGTGPGDGGEGGAGGGGGTDPEPPGSGGTTVDGSGKNDGGTWTATIEICIFGKDGKPLTGQNNTSVRYRVTTPYTTFQEDFQIDSTTGCVKRSYPGLPLGGNFHVEVLNVVDYNTGGGTSPLWDGNKPTFDLTVKP